MARKPVTKLSPTLKELMWDSLKNTKGSQRSQKVKELATLYGPDPATIYRFLKKKEGGIDTPKRSDKGKARYKGYTQEQIDEIAMFASAAKMDYESLDGKTLATRQISEMLVMAEKTEKPIPVSTLDRWMRERNINHEAIKNYRKASTVRLTGRGSNHVWVIDFSTSEMYYMGNRQKMVIDKDVIITDKNHREEKLTKKGYRKVLIGMVVDLYSGAYYSKAYISPGESAELVFRFLCDAMLAKEDDRFVMRGRPEVIYWDRGPGNTSTLVKEMLGDLGIGFICRKRKEAGGKVEARIGAYKRDIERPMMHDKPQTIEEYNSYAFKRILRDNIYKGYFAKWSSIHKTGKLVEFTMDDVTKLGYKREERKVTVRGSISLAGVEYKVSTDIIGQYVTVYIMPDGEMKAMDRNGRTYPLNDNIVEEQTKVFGEEIKKEPLSEYGKLVKEVSAKRKEVRKVKRTHFEGDTEKVEKIVPFDKKGEVKPVEVAHEGIKVKTLTEYWVRIHSEIGIMRTDLHPDFVDQIERSMQCSIDYNGYILQIDYDITVNAILNSREVSNG